MGKQKKKDKKLPKEPLKLNKERLHMLDTQDMQEETKFVTAEDFNLPQTLGNPPKDIRKKNNMAFDSILPQIEGMLGAQHMLRGIGGLSGALFPGFPTLVNLSTRTISASCSVPLPANAATWAAVCCSLIPGNRTGNWSIRYCWTKKRTRRDH